MERIISEQDRIRRAEEIAGRRKGTISARNINVTNTKKKMPLLTKIFIQTVVSMCIFGMAYFLVQNNNPIIDNIRPVLATDINIEQIYSELNNDFRSVTDWYNGFINNTDENMQGENDENTNNENDNTSNETNTENSIEENEVIEETSNEAVGVGGSDENITLSQDEQDIAYIKKNVSIIVPVQGTVTSGYGPRTPTDIISANHAGVDIGANEGTEIIAAMEGTVELVSSYGDYGNHLKITNGEVSTLYAHCSVICVNQGDYVSQGQKIAEVGNTGRTTGPHLHFEISREGRTVNPESIIEI